MWVGVWIGAWAVRVLVDRSMNWVWMSAQVGGRMHGCIGWCITGWVPEWVCGCPGARVDAGIGG